MKKESFFVITLVFILLSTGNLSYGQTIVRENSKYGVTDEKGNIIIPIQYEYISNQKGLFFVRDYRQYKGVFNEKGEPVIKFDEYEYIGFTSGNQYISVKKDGKCGLIDRTGKLIIPIDFDFCSVSENRGIQVKLATSQGWYDLEGKCIVPISMKYTYAGFYRPNMRYITVERGIYQGIWDILEQKEVISPNKYTKVGKVYDDFYYGTFEHKTSLLHNNTVLFTGTGAYIGAVNKDTFGVVYGGKGGYVSTRNDYNFYRINRAGEVLDTCEYLPENIRAYNEDKTFVFHYVSDKYKWGITDTLGNEILPIAFDELGYEEEFHGFEVVNGIYRGVYDLSGKEVIPANKYIEIAYDKILKKYIITNLNNLKGLVDGNGKEILSPKYDDIKSFNNINNFSYVKHNGLIGVIDSTGNEIVPPTFSDVKYVNYHPAIGDFFEINQQGLKGIMTTKGFILVPPIFTKVSIHDPKYYGGNFTWIETCKNQFVGAYDMKCNEIIPANRYAKILYCKTPIPHFRVEDHVGKQGLIDINGNMLFPLSNFNQVSIQTSSESSTGFMIYAKETESNRIIHYELYTNKVLSDNKLEIELRHHIKTGDEYFDKEQYNKAADAYTKAIALKKLDYVIFNRGIACYNNRQYNKAINDFNWFISISKNDNDIERAYNLIESAKQLQSDKVNNAMGFIATLFCSAATFFTATSIPQYNTENYTPHSTYTNDALYGNETNQTSESVSTKKRCGFCGGKGSIVEYVANFGIDERPWCEECGKHVTSGHFHKTCSHCHGAGEY